ncbi:hypothetical protein P4O66_000978 [Electrophorus voltai]|uniref:Uncharacterized protein n=1 Tax=Electrophorus voltai TaxID=2609070 RepID=A0AAD8ZF38_9TELE|nr:hypothetical protein P4O66_000978 [Electrophorus voltai]
MGTSGDAEAKAIEQLMRIDIDTAELTPSQSLGKYKLEFMDAKAEAEVLKELMNIHLEDTGTPNGKPLANQVVDVTFEALREFINFLLEENEKSIHQPLGNQMMTFKDVEAQAEAIKNLMNIHLEEMHPPNGQPLANHVMVVIDDEAEATEKLMCIDLEAMEPTTSQPLAAQENRKKGAEEGNAHMEWRTETQNICCRGQDGQKETCAVTKERTSAGMSTTHGESEHQSRLGEDLNVNQLYNWGVQFQKERVLLQRRGLVLPTGGAQPQHGET